MIWPWIPVLVLLAAEIFFAIALYDWKDQLSHYQRRIDQDRRTCYACITGASVTSFSHRSSLEFCPEHKAHWQLINDLENGL